MIRRATMKKNHHKPKQLFRITSVLTVGTVLLCCSRYTDAAPQEKGPPEDAKVQAAIEKSLRRNEAVSAHLVDVGFTDGVATLEGSVNNLLAERQAIADAQTIRGVHSVVDRLDVQPVNRTDQAIKSDITSALILDPATESFEVDVTVNNGEVELSGTVESWAEKMLCADVARGIKGVSAIENNVTVDYADDRSDAEIRGEILRKLALNPYVHEGAILVDVDDGLVTLQGAVGSARECSEAHHDAYVAGVQKVDSKDLEVKWWVDDKMKKKSTLVFKSDQEIETAVEEALLYDPRTLSFKIGVESENAEVRLTGAVTNLKAKRAAESDAWNTVGVRLVENDIKVRPPDPAGDEELEQNLARALRWDPVVERYEIVPMVRNRKAYLYGKVDTYFERSRAEETAAGIDGIAAVENNIMVDYAWQWKSDELIEESIRDNLYWSTNVDAGDVTVEVEDGEAVLKGTVDSWQELNAAIDNAFEGGAKLVDSRLKIEGVTGFHPTYSHPDYYYQYWFR
ncbi:MAG: BON domain-containing protein [Chitinivibrionales bacterium]|nr:BON domain-containing protein [Chitinivibrionales bacterium]MBD3396509.1 BON domain-containing protein [Chitinivibrionales bacterium]